MAEIIRSHDAFYLEENRYENAKESFKFLGRIMQRKRQSICGGTNRTLSISDWGCANGEFPYHLRKVFPEDRIVGFELLPELLEKARQEVKDVEFVLASILERDSSAAAQFDLTCANGILSIFDAFELVFENLIYWTKPGGAIYIDGLFNNYPIDVNIKYNRSEDYGSGVLESGWNIFSKKSIADYLGRHTRVSKHDFHDFEIPIDLEKKPQDLVRSWTEKRLDGKRYITNGLSLIQPQSVLEIHIK